MKKKHAITTAVVVLLLGILIYAQFRTWRSFNWAEFRRWTGDINPWMLIGGVALTYFVYVLRAVRWAILLRPTKHVPFTRLIASQFIGFTGLSLLGRPGEFIRPYLVARKEGLTFSSQLAVWISERVFDVCTVALMLGITLTTKGDKYKNFVIEPPKKLLNFFPNLHFSVSGQGAGVVVLVLGALLAATFFCIWWRSEKIANFIERILSRFSKSVAAAVCRRVRSFGEGLNTIHGWRSFVALVLLSAAIWLLIARTYIQVLHAYPQTTSVAMVYGSSKGVSLERSGRTVRLHEMKLEDVLIVMGASMVGSIVQLPAVGGGSQLAVISVLSTLFKGEPYNISPELAASCGIMLWLVTFMSVIPAGLFLAHRERISLRAVSEESESEAESE